MLTTQQLLDYLERVYCPEKYGIERKSEWRMGQWMFIVLSTIYPKVWSRLTFTDADCFYDDNKIPNLMRVLCTPSS